MDEWRQIINLGIALTAIGAITAADCRCVVQSL
jgi:hypothetical protein